MYSNGSNTEAYHANQFTLILKECLTTKITTTTTKFGAQIQTIYFFLFKYGQYFVVRPSCTKTPPGRNESDDE